MKNIERFVLKKPLNFDKVVRESVGIGKDSLRGIIIVGQYIQYPIYLRLKKEIKKLDTKIPVFFMSERPKKDVPYNKGPYFIEINCFNFEKNN